MGCLGLNTWAVTERAGGWRARVDLGRFVRLVGCRLAHSVGISGLGYPLLLCLGESLIVILDYELTA